MKYVAVLKTADLPEGEKKRVVVDGRELCVYHLSDGFFATDNRCTHAKAALSEGRVLDDHTIECPRHGSQFAIRTGTVVSLPAFIPVRTFEVKIEDDTIFLKVDDEPRPEKNDPYSP